MKSGASPADRNVNFWAGRGGDEPIRFGFLLVPGFSLVSFSAGAQQYQLRGVSSNSGLPTVGVYLDESVISLSLFTPGTPWIIGGMAVLALVAERRTVLEERKSAVRQTVEIAQRLRVPDTFTPERWYYVGEHARWSREWLADLPADVAERIAWRNAADLFGLTAA